MEIPEFQGTRYVVPLREGGSLPAVVETEDGSLFVTKFRGAGQGARVLVAELLVGFLARQLGLPVPDLCIIHLNESFGRTERDPEIQDILEASRGINVGMRFLEGALNFNPVVDLESITTEFADQVVWFDAFVTNVDRTVRNPNMLLWGRDIHLIDHGSALYFHHDWEGLDEIRIKTPFSAIRQHVLLPKTEDIQGADHRMKALIDEDLIRSILDAIPDELLMDVPEGREPSFESPDENRKAYLDYLTMRLDHSYYFVDEVIRSREHLRQEKTKPLSYRR